jgi:hypothetical protein
MERLTLGGKRVRLPMALVLLMFLAMAGSVLGGCASIDPTDPSHFVDVQVHNDRPTAVQLIQCDTSCDTLHDRQTISAGASSTINVSNEGIEIGYLVENPAGRKLGCIYMKYENVKKRPVVSVSSMTQCH